MNLELIKKIVKERFGLHITCRAVGCLEEDIIEFYYSVNGVEVGDEDDFIEYLLMSDPIKSVNDPLDLID